MSLDDGAADGQADPHAPFFGRVKRLEKFVGTLSIDPDARILHGQAYAIAAITLRFYNDFPRPTVYTAYSLGGIE
jgi:hypothetical protein